MRSDRNPYFFLKKSRDPQVQQWLAQAEGMTSQQIEALNIKPDVKKAMLFVNRMGHQTRSATTAELLADHMQPVTTTSQPMQFHEYVGESVWVNVSARGQIQVEPGTLFALHADRIFIHHNWIALKNNEKILEYSQNIGQGTPTDLNRLIQNKLNNTHLRTQANNSKV